MLYNINVTATATDAMQNSLIKLKRNLSAKRISKKKSQNYR